MLKIAIKKTLPDFILKINFTLNDDILVISGPSGAGKSTLLQCISGLLRPDSGVIKLGNRVLFSSLEKIDLKPRMRNVGYVFQDYALFPHLTVEENILFGLKSRAQREYTKSLQDLLEIFKIKHLIKRYPQEISGGEKQRVAIARAIITKPDIMLLDEPLSALDNTISSAIRSEIKELQPLWKIPFLIVTHSKEDSKFFGDKVLYINNGKQESESTLVSKNICKVGRCI